MHLDVCRYTVLDIETTGLIPGEARIIELALVRADARGAIHEEFSSLVRPDMRVRAGAIHGLCAADLADAPQFPAVARDIVDRFRSVVLVGHNIAFDVAILADEFARLGARLPALPVLCTRALARRFLPRLGRYDLGTCCRALKISARPTHAALPDARAASALLARFLELARRAGCKTLADLGCPFDPEQIGPWPPLPPASVARPPHRRRK